VDIRWQLLTKLIFQISLVYEDRLLIQRSAAEMLLKLLDILGPGRCSGLGRWCRQSDRDDQGIDQNDFFTKNRVKTALRVGSQFLIKLL